jgi:hypothetical protein
VGNKSRGSEKKRLFNLSGSRKQHIVEPKYYLKRKSRPQYGCWISLIELALSIELLL